MRYLVRHPVQLALAILGIALGVASFLGIDLANRSAREAFRLSVEAVSGRATHQVLGPPGGIPESYYVELKRAGATAAPVVEGYLMLYSPQKLTGQDLPAPGRTFRLLGLDVMAEGPFRPYVGEQEGIPLGPLLTRPDTVLMSAPVARSLGLRPGDELPVRLGTRVVPLELLATLSPADELSRRALESVLIADVATAQELLDRPGVLSRIDLIGPPPVPLPAGCRLAAAGERDRTMGRMSEAFHLNLTALSLLSLIVGTFLIYQTASFTVVQRRELWGRLRTLGVTRGEVLRLVLAESLWLGTVGSLLGLALGVALSQGLLRLITRTLNDLYFVVSVEGIELEGWLLARAFLLGLVATALAALAPAREASSSPAGFVLSRSHAEETAWRWIGWMAGAGLMSGAVGSVLLWLPSDSLALAMVGMFLQMVGLAAVAPGVALMLTRLAWRPLALTPLPMRLGVRSVSRSLSRTGVALAALTLAVSATVGIAIMVDSFRGTLVRWLAVTLQEDVFLAPPTVITGRNLSTLDEPLLRRLQRLPGVSSVHLYRGVSVDFRTPRASGTVRLEAAGADATLRRSFEFLASGPDLWADYANGAVLVSEPFAYRHGLRVGDPLELLAHGGWASFPVAGIFADYSATDGIVMLERAKFVEQFRDRRVTAAALTLEPGQDPEAAVDRVRALAGDRELLVRSNRALREASLQVFDRTFAVTHVLRAVATLVAFLGMLGSLVALELERVREVAVLRALGLTPAQTWWVAVSRTAWMGLAAGLLAMPLGVLQALGMIYGINRRSFGWTLQMEVDPWLLLQALGLALGAALLASLYPAWRMTRVPPAAALKEE
ncbi:MAG: ABC transporter permease [Candidatus Eremiobacterota bacterium]